MKYFVFFMLMCVALAAAAPQYLTTWPGGVVAPYVNRAYYTNPNLVTGWPGVWGARYSGYYPTIY